MLRRGRNDSIDPSLAQDDEVSLFLNLSALITVLRFTFKVLAIARKDIFNKYNSSTFWANFWYNGVCCRGLIIILN